MKAQRAGGKRRWCGRYCSCFRDGVVADPTKRMGVLKQCVEQGEVIRTGHMFRKRFALKNQSRGPKATTGRVIAAAV